MCRVIAIVNQKGSVGKTTTVMNLGAALAQKGHRVILVDMDAQGALTVSLGYDPYSIKPSVFDALISPKLPLSKVLHEVNNGLQIIPTNAELVAAEYKLLRETNRTMRLRQILDKVQNELDFILIDTPPSLGLLTVNALVAAHELLIPVAANYLAMRGVRALLESVWLIRERINPELQLLGLVPTMYRADSAHSKAVVAEMRKVFKRKVSRTVIPLDEAASAAPAARKTVIDYLPKSSVAAAYMRLAEEVSHAR